MCSWVGTQGSYAFLVFVTGWRSPGSRCYKQYIRNALLVNTASKTFQHHGHAGRSHFWVGGGVLGLSGELLDAAVVRPCSDERTASRGAAWEQQKSYFLSLWPECMIRLGVKKGKIGLTAIMAEAYWFPWQPDWGFFVIYYLPLQTLILWFN